MKSRSRTRGKKLPTVTTVRGKDAATHLQPRRKEEDRIVLKFTRNDAEDTRDEVRSLLSILTSRTWIFLQPSRFQRPTSSSGFPITRMVRDTPYARITIDQAHVLLAMHCRCWSSSSILRICLRSKLLTREVCLHPFKKIQSLTDEPFLICKQSFWMFVSGAGDLEVILYGRSEAAMQEAASMHTALLKVHHYLCLLCVASRFCCGGAISCVANMCPWTLDLGQLLTLPAGPGG